MDYQNGLLFPGQQQNQQFFNSPSPVPPAQPPPNAPGLYQDPQARFSQQVPQLQYNGGGGFPMASGGAVANSGAMMPAQVHAHQHQQQPRGPPQMFYTSAPYSQGIATSAATSSPHFNQQTKTFSPTNHVSPYASPQGHQQQQQHPDQITSTPMATKAMSQPQAAQQTPQSAARSVPQSPISTEAQAREKERVTLLLEINAELLQEITNLQSQGKGGYTGVPPAGNAEGAKPEMKPASKEYIEILRRLQANLSYLATTAERAQKPNQPVPPGPAIMVAPPSPPSVVEMYGKLQGLFPGWKGQPVKQSPGPQQRAGLPQANSQGSPGQPPNQPPTGSTDS